MSLRDLLTKLEDDGAMALHEVEQVFEAFVSDVVGGLASNGGRTLLSMALQAVQTVAADPELVTDGAKRSAAFGAMLAAVEKAGIQATEGAVVQALTVAATAHAAGVVPTILNTEHPLAERAGELAVAAVQAAAGVAAANGAAG